MPASSTLTILNVDDNEVNRYIRTQVLQSAGYRVSEASTGREALQKYVTEQPSLVLLDVQLPDISGIEVCRDMKGLSNGPVVILQISAERIGNADQVRGLEGGADGYLTEPVEPSLLLATIRAYLRMREAEAERTASERRYRSLVAATSQVVWQGDGQGNLQAALGWSQFSSSPVPTQGSGWLESVHPEEREAAAAAWRSAVETGERFVIEARVRRPNGLYASWIVRGVPVRDGGKLIEWIGTCTDVTEQRRAEEALHRSNEELAQFAHIASHDLQEPLRTMTSFAQLLLRDPLGKNPERENELLAGIVDGGKRMQELIRDLLSFSMVQNTAPAPFQATKLEQVLATATANLRASVQRTGAEITAERLPVVLGDEAQLVQVFQNLISNAIKYRRTGEPPRIQIRMRQGRQEVLISVQDNGVGIDASYTESIFIAFKRLHGREVPGTGIGLAIVKKIIERHGGRIWAESIVGEGSTFYFTLQAIGQEATATGN